MAAKIFDTVDLLVGSVEDGDTRAPFLVVHRQVEYFVLADDEVEALAEVFREKSKAQVGTLPADVLIAAARRAALDEMASTAVDSKAGKPKAKSKGKADPKGKADEPKADEATTDEATTDEAAF